MTTSNRLLNYLGLLGLSLLLTGCGQTQHLSETWTEHTTSFSEQARSTANKGQAQLVVYRPASAGANVPAVNIYIDKHYLTSLRENRYKKVTLCSGAHTINAQSIRHDPAYYKKHNYAYPIDLPEQETVFIKITPEQGEWYISVEPQEQALEELSGTYKQSHALERTQSSAINCSN